MKFPKFITRRRLKWTGLAATFLLAAAMIASYWYWPSVYWARSGSHIVWSVHVEPGGMQLYREWDGRDEALSPYFEWAPHSRQALKDESSYFPSLFSYKPPSFMWLPKYRSSGLDQMPLQYLSIPLWMPLVLTALPTMFLFYRDRKPKPGCCTKCRYDLTGLSSDTCPECGTKIEITDSNKAPASASEGESDAADGGDGVG